MLGCDLQVCSWADSMIGGVVCTRGDLACRYESQRFLLEAAAISEASYSYLRLAVQIRQLLVSEDSLSLTYQHLSASGVHPQAAREAEGAARGRTVGLAHLPYGDFTIISPTILYLV